MSLTVLEVLQNAEINLVNNRNGGSLPFLIGKSQLANAIAQLEKNPDASADFVEEAAAEPVESPENVVQQGQPEKTADTMEMEIKEIF